MQTLIDLLPLIHMLLICVAILSVAHFHAVWNQKRKEQKEAREKERSHVEWPEDLPPLDDLSKQIRDKTALQCSLVNSDPEHIPEDPCATWIGKVVVGLPDEKWPLYKSEPMVGVCQFNLSDAPFIPDELSDVALITVFVAREDENWAIMGFYPDEEEKSYIVRAYPSLDKLTPYLDAPAIPDDINPCGGKYSIFTDYAHNNYEEIHSILDKHSLPQEWATSVDEVIDKLNEKDGDTSWGTKIGGWPAPVQDSIERPVAFQLGEDTSAGLFWIDGGCIYVWRETFDSFTDWEAMIEFY